MHTAIPNIEHTYYNTLHTHLKTPHADRRITTRQIRIKKARTVMPLLMKLVQLFIINYFYSGPSKRQRQNSA